MAESRNPLIEVQENIRVIRLHIIDEAHKKTNEYFTLLKASYARYLQQHQNELQNPPGGDGLGAKITFNKTESEYKNLEKTLMKINKHIDKDFEYVVEIGKDVITYFQNIVSIKQDIESTQAQAESVERNQKLRKLYKKYQKTVSRYNKAGSEFNRCVIEYQSLGSNLQQGIISIPSWTSRTNYSISLEKINNWLNRLNETDQVAQLRDEIKRNIAANQQPVHLPPFDMSTITLTPIQMMSMPAQV